MVSTYTTELRLEQMATGEKSGTWGTIANLQFANLEAAIAGTATVAFASDGNDTLTTASGTDDEARHMFLNLSGGSTLTATRNMVVPTASKLYFVYNGTTGSQSVQIIGATGTGTTVPNGSYMALYHDGTNVIDAASHMSSLTLATALAETSGGTGQSTLTAGDILYASGANALAKLAKGSDDQVLTLASGVPSWAAAADATSISAYAGVLEANANFVDQAIFGPSVDGKSWNGKWGVASLYSSLMLVTIEDAGADTQVNIWDLTEVSSSAPSTTPLGTVTLSGAATPTSVAACMGYIIVGSEDGISIIDPHSGAWAERTVGWPRTLSTSTTPALNDNSVQSVTAGISRGFVRDPLTGGPMPVFAGTYGSGSDIYWYMSGTGNFETGGGTAIAVKGIAFAQDRVYQADTTARVLIGSELELDDDAFNNQGVAWGDTTSPYALIPDNGMSSRGNMLAVASADGLSFVRSKIQPNQTKSLTSVITRAYNTGYLVGQIRGAWLANSKTVDRSYKANTLTENGTVTEAAVESGAELMGYSGFSDGTNYLSRAYDADFDFGTTFSIAVWYKGTSNAGHQQIFHRCNSSNAQHSILLYIASTGKAEFTVYDAGGTADIDIAGVAAPLVDDDEWHFIVAHRDGDLGTIYVDGVQTGQDGGIGTTDDHVDGSATIYIGDRQAADRGMDTGTISLLRISATVPTDTQIRQMYDAEKGMFVASAECLLQSGSTDAVVDVDVDPLTGKVLVTQTDAITIFDGLVVDSKPTVNSGASEKGKLWGDLRAEQNSANAYVTAPAVDQRQVNEMVRGLANEMPAGVDLSKAKAWAYVDTSAIIASYNIKSYTYTATGQYLFEFGVPFKTDDYVYFAGANGRVAVPIAGGNQLPTKTNVSTYSIGTSSLSATTCMVVFFGELENE